MNQQYKYFAFISYSSRDTKWGKKIEKKLSTYKMPSTLCSEHGWKRKPLAPVFFAPYDIQPGGLSEELQQRLCASRNLIVICSPNSAKSEWVGKEIEFFHNLGRISHIHFFIIDGVPHSGKETTECFNPVIDKLGLPEILGANIHEKVYQWPWLNKQRAYVQLITKLLGVEFDTVWQRHKRQLIQKGIAWAIGIAAILAVIFGIWFNSRPIDVKVNLKEQTIQNDNLPPLHNAVVTMMLDNETKTDTIPSLSQGAMFANVPRRFIGKKVRILTDCPNFLSVDTTLILTKDVTIYISRDASVYGDIYFRLWNPNTETFVNDAKLQIAGHEIISSNTGEVKLQLPIEQQLKVYKILTAIPLESDNIIMPCGKDDVICVK